MLQALSQMIKQEPVRFLNGIKSLIYVLTTIGLVSFTDSQVLLIENTTAVLLFGFAGLGVEIVISEIERSQVSPINRP